MHSSQASRPDRNKYPHLRDQFPQILENLELLWGYKEFYVYHNSLTLQSRDRPRDGFAQDVVIDLFQIEQDHQRCLPRHQPSDVWAVDNWAA